MKKPQILTTYEYSSKQFAAPITAATSFRLNEVIDQLNKHVNSKVLEPIMNSRNQTIGVQAFQYVGVVHVDKTLSIEVLPKMYKLTDSEQDDRKTCIDNLFFMLDYCGQISMPNTHVSQLNRTRGSFFETLIYLYAADLMDCIQNSAHHEYIENEENLTFIKGTLMLSEHLKYNSVNQSRFYMRNDEFTADNNLNRLLKYVSRMLLAATNNNRNRLLLREIIAVFDEVSDRKMTAQDAERIHLTRLNIRFDQSLRLSKLFLTNQSLQLNASSYDSFTFLIDMNSLFEDFIATALRKAVSRYGDSTTKVKSQGPIKTFVDRTQYDERGLFYMKPDISLLKDGDVSCIIDTKYKVLNNERKQNVSQADLYQMFAYAKKYNTGDITLLYPNKPDEEVRKTDYDIHGDGSCVIKIRTFDIQRNLRADKAKSFEAEVYAIATKEATQLAGSIYGG